MTVLPSRRAQIIRLLETRDQHLPVVKSQWANFGAQPGEKATEPKPCRACGETGQVNGRNGKEPCGNCGGNGKYLVDSYTGRRDNDDRKVEQLTGPERADWRRTVDGKVARITAELAGGDDLSPYGWEIARQRMLRQFDYAPLDAALEIVRLIEEPGYRLLHRVFVYRIAPEPSASSSAGRLLEHSLMLVDGLMPTHIRAPEAERPVAVRAPVAKGAGRQAFGSRNQQVRAAIDAGESTADVAARWGLSARRVNEIVKGDAT